MKNAHSENTNTPSTDRRREFKTYDAASKAVSKAASR
jgi:hypothetical protein